MRKKLLAVFALCLIFMLHLSMVAFAAGTIKVTLVQKTDTSGWSDKKVCNHYYFIYKGDQEVVSKTLFPNDATTVIELPKTKENYTIRFGYDGTYSTGQPNEFDMVEGIEKTFPGNKSIKLTFNCSLRGAAHGLWDLNGFSFDSLFTNTAASENAGESGVSVPGALVIGLASAAAAAAGAGAAGAAGSAAGGTSGTDGGAEEADENGSTYKMYVYKEFGDKIKYSGDTVFVYARMAEVTKEGEEVERSDLTQKIEIFSRDGFLTVGEAVFSGSYMGASVDAAGQDMAGMPKEGTISFKFTGAGGTFQNNVTFKMVGDCYIGLAGPNLYTLGGSGNSFELLYELKDFLNEAEVSVSCMQKDAPFTLDLKKDKEGNTLIAAIDSGEKKPFEKFFDSYSCEIVAQNEKEYARTVFSTVACHEGLLPDFLGKPHEIRGYKNEKGEMEETLIAFKLGRWNDQEKTLDFVMPEEIEIDCDDEKDVFETIGLDFEKDEDSIRDDAVLYRFKAKISLPEVNSVKGKLTATCKYGDVEFENETDIALIPDIQEYYDSLDKEYEKCRYIINTYITEEWRERKLAQLEKARPAFGVKDYQKFRRDCWQFARNLILQEKESYLQQSYTADIAIAYLEIYVYIGNAAFDIALMPVGGPIAGFLAAQAKDGALELIKMRIEKGEIGIDGLIGFLKSRVAQAMGQADGAVAMPKPSEPGKLAVWLSCFFLYRFVWHWYYTQDDNKNPVGITGALENAAYDFAAKGVTSMLGNFVEEIAPKSGFAGNIKEVYNREKDEALAKPVTDAGEKVLETLMETLTGFLQKIRNGLA